MRLHWGKTFVLGFGFFAISAAAVLYDSYMPDIYHSFITSSSLVGAIMGIDNFLGMTLQPYFGALSDQTESRWGRRRPFLLLGMPIAALMLMTIPFARQAGLLALLAAAIVLNLALAFFRSPTIALMPDLTPRPLRSLANGVINLMGGVGSTVVLFLGAKLYGMDPGYPFFMVAGLVVSVFLLFLLVIREPKERADEEQSEPNSFAGGLWNGLVELVRSLVKVFVGRDRNMLFLFLSMFAYSAGYQAINTWFTRYGLEMFGVPINEASKTLIFYSGAFVLGAIPAGYVGTKLGKRAAMAIGLSVGALCFGWLHFANGLGGMMVPLVVGGLCWSLININAYPFAVSLCRPSQTGTYTGVYYIFTGLAGVSGPFISGLLFDLVGSKRPLFLFGMAFFAISLLLMLTVRKDEDVPAKA